MSAGAQELVVFGLTLHVEEMEEDQFRMRAVYRIPALTAGITLYATRDELADLLAQIERQYHAFDKEVAWRVDRAGRVIDLGWGLDSIGHVTEGRVRMVEGDWALDARLDGDQSYLPSIALGLHLLLRGPAE